MKFTNCQKWHFVVCTQYNESMNLYLFYNFTANELLFPNEQINIFRKYKTIKKISFKINKYVLIKSSAVTLKKLKYSLTRRFFNIPLKWFPYLIIFQFPIVYSSFQIK